MKKTITISLIATLIFSGCTNTDDFIPSNNGNENDKKTIITASTNSDKTTKMSFEDKGDNGIKLTWDEGDGFTLYDTNGHKAADFKLVVGQGGSTNGDFEKINGSVMIGANYTVVFPMSTTKTLVERNRSIRENNTQSAHASMEHMSDICFMTANYTYNIDANVGFVHEFAVLTVNVASPAGYVTETHGAPTNLTVYNGVSTYNLNISGITDLGSTKTFHTLIDPAPGNAREIRFGLTTENGYYFETKIATSKAYAAGMRYTADLSGGNALALVDGLTLAQIASIPFANLGDLPDTWVITDALTASTSYDSQGFMFRLNEISNNTSRKISIVFPNATDLPAYVLHYSPVLNSSALVSVSAPKATSIGDFALFMCDGLVSVNFPLVKTVELSAFSQCSSLASVVMPSLETINRYAFEKCLGLTELYFASVKTVKDFAFVDCEYLTEVFFPMATTIGDFAFGNCDRMKTVTLPSFSVVTNDWSINTVEHVTLGLTTVAGLSVRNSLKSINLPAATEVPANAFFLCTALETLNLPAVTSIGANALDTFSDELKLLVLATDPGAEITSWDSQAFGYMNTGIIDLVLGEKEFAKATGKVWRSKTFKSITKK